MPSCITRHRLQRRLLTLYLHQRHCQRICRRHLQQRDRLSQRPLCWRKVCRFYGRTQREACTSFGRSSGACWQVVRLRDWRACLCDRRNMSPDGAPLLQSCLCLPDVLTAHCLRDVLTAHVPPGTCRFWGHMVLCRLTYPPHAGQRHAHGTPRHCGLVLAAMIPVELRGLHRCSHVMTTSAAC